MKNKTIFNKCAQNRGAHVQCMNNHYAKFKYLGIKIVGVKDYTNQTPSKKFMGKKIILRIKTPKMK